MSRMSDLEGLAWHRRGVETCVEAAFAEQRRDVAEFIHAYVLKGLDSDAKLKAFYDYCAEKYGALPRPEQPAQRVSKPADSSDGTPGATVSLKPNPKPIRPNPGGAVPLNAMFANVR